MYPAFYNEIAIIDRKRDAAMQVEPVQCFEFARKETVLPAVCDELPALAGAYPVVFTDHDIPVMVTILGHGSNRFIGPDGAWAKESYIPLVVRSYPFAGLYDQNDDLLFCMDKRYRGTGELPGERVFTENGELAPFGAHAALFANHFATSMKKTHRFSRKLKELDLLIPAEVAVEKEGLVRNFTGLNQVNMEKLADLPPDVLKEMIDSREMYSVYLHHFSLNNFSKII